MATPDLMAFLITNLTTNTEVVSAFGHSLTTPKFHADEADPAVSLPFLVYSEPTEAPIRVFTGDLLAIGEVEIGVLDTTKSGARSKIDLVRTTLNGIPLPQILDGGVLIYFRNSDNRSRPIGTTAPGAGVAEYGRAMVFHYQLTRTDT